MAIERFLKITVIMKRSWNFQKMEHKQNKSSPKYIFEIANWTRISLDLTEYSNLQIVIACAGGTNIKKEREEKKSNSGSSVI